MQPLLLTACFSALLSASLCAQESDGVTSRPTAIQHAAGVTRLYAPAPRDPRSVGVPMPDAKLLAVHEPAHRDASLVLAAGSSGLRLAGADATQPPQRHNTFKGALTGALVGFVLGAITGAQINTGCEPANNSSCSTSRRRRNLVLGGGVVGAGAGAAIGASRNRNP